MLASWMPTEDGGFCGRLQYRRGTALTEAAHLGGAGERDVHLRVHLRGGRIKG